MMSIMHTHLRVPYEACVNHIRKNLRRNLKVQIIKPELPDKIQTMPMESIADLNIADMQEKACNRDNDTENCLFGTILYQQEKYKFHTHQSSYDVVLILRKMTYPFQHIKIMLPITSWNEQAEDKIYIPPEYTTDAKVIPVEFVWEFLSQFPVYLNQSVNEVDCDTELM